MEVPKDWQSPGPEGRGRAGRDSAPRGRVLQAPARRKRPAQQARTVTLLFATYELKL